MVPLVVGQQVCPLVAEQQQVFPLVMQKDNPFIVQLQVYPLVKITTVLITVLVPSHQMKVILRPLPVLKRSLTLLKLER